LQNLIFYLLRNHPILITGTISGRRIVYYEEILGKTRNKEKKSKVNFVSSSAIFKDGD
jgi:hypothetical protein